MTVTSTNVFWARTALWMQVHRMCLCFWVWIWLSWKHYLHIYGGYPVELYSWAFKKVRRQSVGGGVIKYEFVNCEMVQNTRHPTYTHSYAWQLCEKRPEIECVKSLCSMIWDVQQICAHFLDRIGFYIFKCHCMNAVATVSAVVVAVALIVVTG